MGGHLPPARSFSTTAAASNYTRTLGWVDNGSSTVTVMQTIPGDADLSGAVGSSDLSVVMSHFGQAGVWATGDMDYNGFVGSSDMSIVLSHFGQSLPQTFNLSLYPNLSAEAISMLNAAGIKTVPEPGTIAILATGLLGLLVANWVGKMGILARKQPHFEQVSI